MRNLTNPAIEQRIEKYARAIKTTRERVVSIKFRPTMPGTVYEDESNRQFTDAYMYASEYEAAAREVTLRDTPLDLKAVDGGSEIMAVDVGNQRPVLWLPHETGLEVLADHEFLFPLIRTILELYKAIRDEIRTNKTKKESGQEADRYYGSVDALRLEKRYFDKEGNLRSETIVSIPIHENTAQLQRLLSAALGPDSPPIPDRP